MVKDDSFYLKALQEHTEYKDGQLVWKTGKGRRVMGSPLGTPHNRGYMATSLEGRRFLVHTLVFAYHNGYFPTMVDHIDGDRLNNRIENLRECDYNENGYNSKLRKDNTSGHKNVSWSRVMKKWCVRLGTNKKYQVVGYFDTVDNAALVAAKVREERHGVFAKHN